MSCNLFISAHARERTRFSSGHFQVVSLTEACPFPVPTALSYLSKREWDNGNSGEKVYLTRNLAYLSATDYHTCRNG